MCPCCNKKNKAISIHDTNELLHAEEGNER